MAKTIITKTMVFTRGKEWNQTHILKIKNREIPVMRVMGKGSVWLLWTQYEWENTVKQFPAYTMSEYTVLELTERNSRHTREFTEFELKEV